MPRLIDYLRSGKVQPSRRNITHKGEPKLLASAVPVVADNVAEYIWSKENAPRLHVLTDSDMPVLAPPFPNCFIEWKEPYTRAAQVASHIGIHMYATEDVKKEPYYSQTVKQGVDLTNARWLILSDLYFLVTEKQEAIGPGMHRLMYLDEKGRRITEAEYRYLNISEEEMKAFHNYWLCAWMTVSFLHCKNVVVEDVVPPAKLAKATLKRRGITLVTFKTLMIEPMKEVLRSVGKSHTEGLAHSLHICRGYFADYTDGKGLFGKHKGVYWFGQKVRGSAAQGVTMKEYAVEIPDEKN